MFTFRLDIKWLKPDYRDKRTRKYAKLTQKEKRVIDGVHQRDFSNGLLPDQPSNEDYKVLNEAYEKRREFNLTTEFTTYVLRLLYHAWLQNF